MSKNFKPQQYSNVQEQEVVENNEMSVEEARAYRASKHKPAPQEFSEEQKREQFRVYWASEKAKYGKLKELEKSIWLHLKSTNMDSPEQFEVGLAHFGLKKIKE